MKDIGRTNEGNYIVELSQSEYSTIYELQRMLDGETSVDMFRMHPELRDSSDLSPTFMAIRAFIEGGFYINALQNYVNRLKQATGIARVNTEE